MIVHAVCYKDTVGFTVPCVGADGRTLTFEDKAGAEKALDDHAKWLTEGLSGVVRQVKVPKKNFWSPGVKDELHYRWRPGTSVADVRKRELRTLFIKVGKIAV